MATYRKLSWTEADMKCPFYIKDDRGTKSICCEGYETDSVTVTKFKTLGGRDRHMGIYCAARYEQCPMYKAVCRDKYGEDTKNGA